MCQNMEKRRSKRKPVSLDTSLIAEGANCSGYIENICEHGFHLITSSSDTKSAYIPEAIFELEVPDKSGTMASLQCEVRWVHINKTPIHGLTYRMGMEILNQPPEYQAILNTL